MKTRKARFTFAVLALLVGCGGGSGDDGGKGNPNGAIAGPPDKRTDTSACIISADCPGGQHCDLGECIQSCNKVDPCSGELTCSPRGRCIEEGKADEDPPPSTTFKGEVSVAQTDYLLTDRDRKLEIALETSSSEPVRYRVEVNAPHLRIGAPRGEFTGKKTIVLDVVTDGLKGRDVGGSVRIITSLGEVVVNAPIHVGLTGAYKGALRYDGGPVYLGDVQLSLDMIESGGEVKVRVDSRTTVLFPTTSSGETTGRGSFTLDKGADITLVQYVPKTLGGARNRFGRDVGRKLRLLLKPGDRGELVGTFEETIYGLFSLPTKLTGKVSLAYQPNSKDPVFEPGTEPAMPAAPVAGVFLSPSEVFGWTAGSCEQLICNSSTCIDPRTAVSSAETTYAKPLNDTMVKRTVDPSKPPSSDPIATSTEPFTMIADACRSASKATSKAGYDASTWRCGLPTAVACALPVAAKAAATDSELGRAFGRMTLKSVAPALLVAKDEVVRALSESFTAGGVLKEKQRYDAAMTALAPAAQWILQPAVLEQLRSLTAAAAKGTDPATGDTSTENDTYPAARALADLFVTTASIDGERARLDAVAEAGAQDANAKKAQERAVVSFLEAAALSEILTRWSTTPKSVGAKMLGMLTPLDAGFTALRMGANVFGVPTGFMPFVYRPTDTVKGATNFEQMLAIAGTDLKSEATLESAFFANKREYDRNAANLQTALKDLRLGFDSRLKDFCGEGFDPAAIVKPEDWSTCGATGTGEVAVLKLDIESANLRVKAAQTRLEGINKKVQIDVKRLAETQAVHADTIHFIDQTGKEVRALTFMQGLYDAMIESAKVASGAQLLNFGAPLAEAAVVGAVAVMKANLTDRKAQLETALSMKHAESAAKIEMINALADIQKQLVDAAAAAVDVDQELLVVLQTNLKLRNALTSAKNLLAERQKAYALVEKDPQNDPSFRILRDQQAMSLLRTRADAQKQMFLAASALSYEINTKIPGLEGAVMNANNASALDQLSDCLSKIYNRYRVAYGSPQDYAATVSVRKLLGINGPRVDSVTGVTLSEGEQFRRLLLQNQNLDGKGGVGIAFATNLQPGNGLWSSDVCNDRLTTVQAQIVGDFLGDNQAQVNLSLTGGAYMRGCDGDRIETWMLGRPGADASSGFAVLQSGVNTFGDAPSPNTSLFGQSVARASWKVVIPGASSAPSNADLDLSKIEDIVLKLGHAALPRKSTPVSVDLSCLATIGK
jgi:hypothetical protein